MRLGVCARACARACGCACLGVCVRVCVWCCSRACASRLEDCACLSPCVGDGYAPLSVLSHSVRSAFGRRYALRSVVGAPRSLSLSLSCGGVCGRWLAFFVGVYGTCFLTCTLWLAFCVPVSLTCFLAFLLPTRAFFASYFLAYFLLVFSELSPSVL